MNSLKMDGGGQNIEKKKEKNLVEVRCGAKKIVNILSDDHQKKILEKEGGVVGRGGSWNQLTGYVSYELDSKCAVFP